MADSRTKRRQVPALLLGVLALALGIAGLAFGGIWTVGAFLGGAALVGWIFYSDRRLLWVPYEDDGYDS